MAEVPIHFTDRRRGQSKLNLAEQLRYVQQGHGRSGNNRDYVLSTVKSIEAQGFRDPQLHQLALMLHGDKPLHG